MRLTAERFANKNIIEERVVGAEREIRIKAINHIPANFPRDEIWMGNHINLVSHSHIMWMWWHLLLHHTDQRPASPLLAACGCWMLLLALCPPLRPWYRSCGAPCDSDPSTPVAVTAV